MANTVDIVLRSIDKASADIKKVNGELKKTDKTAAGMKAGLKSAGLAVAGVSAALGTMALVGKKAFEWAEQGAMLDLSKTKLDRLARTIDTTGDALQRKLYQAMGGLASKTEAAALGTDLLSLGLVKSSDEAARMAGVVGKLGMNMNQLVLTLTNQTTMRFDALGVSVDGFKERVNALKDSGVEANEAFRLAFLEQAEEQVRKVGDVADTSAGQFMKLKAGWKDWTDAVKEDLATALVPAITEINNIRDAKAILKEAIDMGLTSWDNYDQAIQAATYGELDLVAAANELLPALDEAHAALERTALLPPISLASKLGIDELQSDLESVPGEAAKSKWSDWSTEAINNMALVQQWQNIIAEDGISEAEKEETADLMDVLGFGDRKEEVFEAMDNFNTLSGDMSGALDMINKTVNPTVHVVAEGDTLSSIAKKYGSTIAAILDMNNLEDANLINVNQKLTVRSDVHVLGDPDPRAGGGPLTGFNLVGEAGPELIVGNQVIPAGPTRRLLNAGLQPAGRFVSGGEIDTTGYGVIPSGWGGISGMGRLLYGGSALTDEGNQTWSEGYIDPYTGAYTETAGGSTRSGGGRSAPKSSGGGRSAPAAAAPPPAPMSLAEIANTTESTAASVGVQMAQVITAEMGKNSVKSNQLQSEMLAELRKLPKVADIVLAFRNAIEQAVQ